MTSTGQNLRSQLPGNAHPAERDALRWGEADNRLISYAFH